jgi:glucose-6-phosphate dehydrogenase assembly protein OpcA
MPSTAGTEHAVWSAEDTSPSEVDVALRRLLMERHAEDEAFVPARVLNLIAIVDADWRGEIENRLERLERFNPSRTILVAVERKRTTIDARVSMGAEAGEGAGAIHVGEELVELWIGESHLGKLLTIVDPLIVPDLATLAWSPHGYDEAVESLVGLVGVVMVDSVQAGDPRAQILRVQRLLEGAYVVDLAWLRSAPWRERIAATFDPPGWREALDEITAVTVRHHPDSAVSGTMLLGWLASRLGWEPAKLEDEDGGFVARAKTAGRKVKLRLEADPSMPVPGLAGIAIETASGMKLSLFRGPGGLTAKRKLPGGKESSWVVLGASRGEAGILGEGIRQALLRDPTYGPALTAACEMLAA